MLAETTFFFIVTEKGMAVVASLMELSQTVCDVNELHSCQWLDFRAGLRQALRHQDVKDIDTYLNKIVTVSYFVSVQNRETKILMSCGEVVCLSVVCFEFTN